MTILDFVEAWWQSVQQLLAAYDVTGKFERSQNNRLNPSCSLNLRRGPVEADLLVWESGEAELAAIKLDGSIQQYHFEDVRKQGELAAVLSRLAALALPPQNVTR